MLKSWLLLFRGLMSMREEVRLVGFLDVSWDVFGES